MPTEKTKKNVKSFPVKVKKKKSGGKTAIVSIVVIVLILLVLYFLLGRKTSTTVPVPPETARETESQTETGPSSEKMPQQQDYVISKAKLALESMDNQNIIKVIIDRATGRSGTEIAFRYDWSVNGKPAGDGSSILKGFKGGDNIAVKITPIDGEKVGQSKTLELTIRNVPPQVADDKQPKYDGKTFSYQVKGTSQDGNPLTYSLEEAPEGMTIDKQTGRINWELEEEDYGEHSIKVKVADNKGASTIFTFKADLKKPAEEKKPAEGQK